MNVKITPKPRFKRQGVNFAELEIRDCFIWDEELFMKTNQTDNQEAVSLSDGRTIGDMCTEFVLPVNVEIKWTKKP